MDFKKTNEKCVLANLTGEDMTSFGLTYDEIDYCNEKTRCALKDILSKAQSETGFESCSRLRIDVMPGEPDGCMILFTDIGGFDELDFSDEQIVFESESFNNIADCAAVLSSLEITVAQSSLYGNENAFRLIVKGADERTISLICEYTQLCRSDSISVARTKEAMNCLIENNALEVLCGKIAKS